VQSFKGAVKPQGEARPTWKVLRVLGNLLSVNGFDYESSEAVLEEVLAGASITDRLNNHIEGEINPATPHFEKGEQGGFARVSDVPIYATDALVRRAIALQKTRDAAEPCLGLNNEELRKLGITPGASVKVTQGSATITLKVEEDNTLPMGTAHVAAGVAATAELGAMYGRILVEPLTGELA
jgi:NADH-quinone oxidoreductase subunit G